MANKVIAILNDPFSCDPGAVISWITVMDAETSAVQTGSFDDFIEAYRKSSDSVKIASYLSGYSVTSARVFVPVKNTRLLKQAVPNVVEEEIASNIEDLHLAIGSADSAGRIPVNIVQKAIMTYWVDLFADNDLPLVSLKSLPDALEVKPGGISILLGGTTALLKSEAECLQAEAENIEEYLDLVLSSDEDEAIQSISIRHRSGVKAFEEFAKKVQLEMEGEGRVSVEIEPIDLDLLSCIAMDDNRSGIELLVDEFSTDGNQSLIQQWLPVAAGVVLALLLQVLFNVGSGYFLNHRAEGVEASTVELYKQFFPDEKVVSVRRQFEAKINAMGGGSAASGFALLFGSTATAIKSMGAESRMVLRQFRYDERNGKGELRLDIDAPSISSLDELKQKIVSGGYQVSILSANEEGAVIKASVLIQAG